MRVQIAPLVLWLILNHVCYNQNAPLAIGVNLSIDCSEILLII
jgi:hypothetical protein